MMLEIVFKPFISRIQLEGHLKSYSSSVLQLLPRQVHLRQVPPQVLLRLKNHLTTLCHQTNPMWKSKALMKLVSFKKARQVLLRLKPSKQHRI